MYIKSVETKLFSFIFVLFFLNSTSVNSSDLQNFSSKFLENIWRFQPVEATQKGVHTYDTILATYTNESVKAEIDFLLFLKKQVLKINTENLSVDDNIDRRLLLSNIDMKVFQLKELKSWRKNPVLYVDECINGIYFLMLRDFAPISIRAKSIQKRLIEIPRVMKEARENIKNPPKIYVIVAIEEITEAINFLNESISEIAKNLDSTTKESIFANRGIAIKSMNEYKNYLQEVLPSCPENFAIGKKNYEFWLYSEHLLDFDSEELLSIGERVFAETDSAIKILEAEMKKEEEKKTEEKISHPSDFSKKDVLNYYKTEIESVKQFVIKNNIADVPSFVGELRVIETPKFMRGLIPGIAMEPAGPFDSVNTSYFYIRPIPDSMDEKTKERYFNIVKNRGFRGGVVHEGYPGHHLQLSIANKHHSNIRKYQQNAPFVEGWALYCEEMMGESGLFKDQKWHKIGVLGGVKFRAARVILDVNLQTGKWSYEQALKFMIEKFGGDSVFFKGEVRRYCLSPTQPMSYLVGKLAIMKLREDMKRKLKEKFSLYDFHNAILKEGSIPPKLIELGLSLSH